MDKNKGFTRANRIQALVSVTTQRVHVDCADTGSFVGLSVDTRAARAQQPISSY